MKTRKVIILIPIFLFFISELYSATNDSVDMGKSKTNNHYKGSAQTEIMYYEFNVYTNQNVYVGTKTYNYEVDIFIADPLVSSDNLKETNPFNIKIYPIRETSLTDEGHIDISSAGLFTSTLGGNVLLQYWKISSDGKNISGTLTKTHVAEAAASNLLWAWRETVGLEMTWPFVIGKNAKMSGAVNSNKIYLEINGESECRSCIFKTIINGQLLK